MKMRNEALISALHKKIQFLEQDLYEAEKYRNWDRVSELKEKLADTEFQYQLEYERK